MIAMHFDLKKGVWVEEQDGVERLTKNYFGELRNGKVWLKVEEALYLIAFQNAYCYRGDDRIGFSELASHFPEKRLFTRFNAYRDWRDRGLVIERFRALKGKKTKKGDKKYPARPLEKRKLDTTAYWYPDDLTAVIEDPLVGKDLFEKHWLGQFGVYKQDRGEMLKLDFFETIFLAKHFGLKVVDVNSCKEMKHTELLKTAAKARQYAKQIFEVYEDWRLKGYVVKSGFKFGSHFRIYFPGASPGGGQEYVHSRHVLHVFPKEEKLLISEWARAVRVAHGVKKTFILGIPELTEGDYIDYPADFIAYRRKKEGQNWIRETPEDKPRYLLAAVAEDEMIGGVELASLLKKATDMGLELILSITDRETAITYYILKKVQLPGSEYEYYEIEWMKP